MNDLTKCFLKESDFATRSILGETIIVPIKGGVGDLNSIYVLNELGTQIWELINGKTSINRIIKEICEAYDVGPEEAEKDTMEFLSSLEGSGLIRSTSRTV
jgi:Coenzyme PQQ synthesis protein D (PqqD)